MTKEQHLKLQKYESIFRTAIDSKYYRAMDSRFASDFISICKELNIYINPNCPACVLRALQTLGNLYFDYVEPVEPEAPVSPESPEKAEDNKPIESEKKVKENEPKNKKKAK